LALIPFGTRIRRIEALERGNPLRAEETCKRFAFSVSPVPPFSEHGDDRREEHSGARSSIPAPLIDERMDPRVWFMIVPPENENCAPYSDTNRPERKNGVRIDLEGQIGHSEA
jgi:hypothetical protein